MVRQLRDGVNCAHRWLFLCYYYPSPSFHFNRPVSFKYEILHAMLKVKSRGLCLRVLFTLRNKTIHVKRSDYERTALEVGRELNNTISFPPLRNEYLETLNTPTSMEGKVRFDFDENKTK